MPKLRRLAGRDVLTILHGFGFQQASQRGSHVKLVREVSGSRQVLTVPLHTELDPGTLRAIFRKPVTLLPSKTSVRISTHKSNKCFVWWEVCRAGDSSPHRNEPYGNPLPRLSAIQQ